MIRVVGIAEEVTERKRYEAELDSRTGRREAANRARRAVFSPNTSYEIRGNATNGVIGMTQLPVLTIHPRAARRLPKWQASGRNLLTLS